MTDEAWLTKKEAALFCGVSQVPASDAEQYPHDRPRLFGIDFPYARFDGRRYLFRKSELAAWKETRQRLNARKVRASNHRRLVICGECGDPWPCSKSDERPRCHAANCNVIVGYEGELCAVHRMWSQVLDVIS